MPYARCLVPLTAAVLGSCGYCPPPETHTFAIDDALVAEPDCRTVCAHLLHPDAFSDASFPDGGAADTGPAPGAYREEVTSCSVSGHTLTCNTMGFCTVG